MAQTSYTTARVTAQTRLKAYEKLSNAIQHIPYLGVDLVSVVVNADNSITVTLTGPINAEQREHLGL